MSTIADYSPGMLARRIRAIGHGLTELGLPEHSTPATPSRKLVADDRIALEQYLAELEEAVAALREKTRKA